MTNPMLAIWDSGSSLVPCKVRRIERDPDAFGTDKYLVVAVVTAARGAYRRGEEIATQSHYMWPRDCARPKRGTYGQKYIVGPYNWHERLENNRPR